jgi:hypothetical protein
MGQGHLDEPDGFTRLGPGPLPDELQKSSAFRIPVDASSLQVQQIKPQLPLARFHPALGAGDLLEELRRGKVPLQVALLGSLRRWGIGRNATIGLTHAASSKLLSSSIFLFARRLKRDCPNSGYIIEDIQ